VSAHAPYLTWLTEPARTAPARRLSTRSPRRLHRRACRMPTLPELAANHVIHACCRDELLWYQHDSDRPQRCRLCPMWDPAATTMATYPGVSGSALARRRAHRGSAAGAQTTARWRPLSTRRRSGNFLTDIFNQLYPAHSDPTGRSARSRQPERVVPAVVLHRLRGIFHPHSDYFGRSCSVPRPFFPHPRSGSLRASTSAAPAMHPQWLERRASRPDKIRDACGQLGFDRSTAATARVDAHGRRRCRCLSGHAPTARLGYMGGGQSIPMTVPATLIDRDETKAPASSIPRGRPRWLP